MYRRARDDRPQRDYYAVLGVPVTASRDEINRAYRRRARATHPDLNGGDRAAEHHFDELAAAREVLADPTARAAYDRSRAARSEPSDHGGGDGDPGAQGQARPERPPVVPPSSIPVLGGRPNRPRPSGATIQPGPVVWRPSEMR